MGRIHEELVFHGKRASRMEGSNEKQRIAVIGAGPGGLVAAKVVKEGGFDVVVYEVAASKEGHHAASIHALPSSCIHYINRRRWPLEIR